MAFSLFFYSRCLTSLYIFFIRDGVIIGVLLGVLFNVTGMVFAGI